MAERTSLCCKAAGLGLAARLAPSLCWRHSGRLLFRLGRRLAVGQGLPEADRGRAREGGAPVDQYPAPGGRRESCPENVACIGTR